MIAQHRANRYICAAMNLRSPSPWTFALPLATAFSLLAGPSPAALNAEYLGKRDIRRDSTATPQPTSTGASRNAEPEPADDAQSSSRNESVLTSFVVPLSVKPADVETPSSMAAMMVSPDEVFLWQREHVVCIRGLHRPSESAHYPPFYANAPPA